MITYSLAVLKTNNRNPPGAVSIRFGVKKTKRQSKASENRSIRPEAHNDEKNGRLKALRKFKKIAKGAYRHKKASI